MFNIFWILLGISLLGLYSALMLKDDKTPETDPSNKKLENQWHFVGAAFFCYFAVSLWFLFGFHYVPFCLSSFWLIFGGIIHKVALKQEFFFVGTTAKTDIFLRKLFPTSPTAGSALLKVSCFIISTIYLILKIF
jgi:hypothetical protein